MSWSEVHNKFEIQNAVAAGDPKAFQELYVLTYKQLYTAINALVRDPETSRDITQASYLKVWEKRGKLSGIKDLGKYLFVLGRNASIDHLRRLKLQKKFTSSPSVEESGYSNNIIEKLDHTEVREKLEKAVRQLPPRQRDAWQLSFEKELSHEEIAEKMSISPFTAIRHIDAARRFVRRFISTH